MSSLAAGNIGIGTTTPAAKLDITGGNVNLENSSATAGTVLKAGAPFLHNYGSHNTFLGLNAGNLTMSGVNNTATGYLALTSNTSGNNNTAAGYNALAANNSGSANTAIGFNTLPNLSDLNSYNTALGALALFNLNYGEGNTALGQSAGYFLQGGYYNIFIGNGGGADPNDSYTIRIGEPGLHTRFFAAGVYNSPVVGAYVCVNSNSQLGFCVIPAGATSDEVQSQQREIEQLKARLEALELAVAASAPARP
jgi:hypothetical protein